MSKFKFELNSAGVRELLNSSGMVNILQTEANKVKNKCGDGYETTTYHGKTRPNVSIKAESTKAKVDNNKHNTLLKALK